MTRDSSNRFKLPTTLPRLGRISDPLQAAGEDSDDSSSGSTGGSDDGKRHASVRGFGSAAAIGRGAYQNNHHVDFGFYDDDEFDSSSSSSDSSASVVPVAKAKATAFGSSSSTATAGAAAAAAASSSGNNRLASIINPDTMAAAAAIMARDQSSRGRPVLLGSNTTDGTINVQLPTGMVIAVEATAFPDYNRTTATTTTTPATTTTKQPNNDNRTSTTAATAKSTSTLVPKAVPVAATAAAASKVPATAKTAPTQTVAAPVPVQPVPQPQQQPPQERATSKATVAEIERALPAAASCVFHIFDRRVNLDAHSGRTSDHTYSLLRAWAQDDPYRHGYYDEATVLVEQPSVVTTTVSTAALPGATRDPTVQKNTTTSRAVDSNATRKLSENQHAVSLSTQPTIDELRTIMIQKARATKKQKVRHWKRDDAEIMRRLKERGIDL